MTGLKPNDNITIDSLRIRIPTNKITNLDNELNQEIFKFNGETGEILNPDNPNIPLTKYIQHNGIKIGFGIKSLLSGKAISEEYLTVEIHSKQLKENYFTGLTPTNIKDAYNYIMSLNVVKFSFEDFINSSCSDVDFKKDILLTQEQYRNLIDKIKEIARPYKEKNKGYHEYNRKYNQGIEWTDRRYSKMTYPYLKIYNKYKELTRISEFINTYLPEINIKSLIDLETNLFRVEFQIKNTAHFNRYGITDISLKNILNLE